MTCIVGLVEDGKVYIGGDSAGVGGLCLTVRADPKVFKVGEALIGYTSSFRMGQILRYKLKLPKVNGDDLYRYMVTDFVDEVRTVLKENGYSTVKDNVEIGGTFLVGLRGRLFNVCSDYQVGENRLPFDAVGCGQDPALGSLFSTQQVDMTPKQRIRLALESAEAFSAGVRGPFVIIGR